MGLALRVAAGVILFFTGMIAGMFVWLLIPPRIMARIMSRLALGRLADALPGPLGKNLHSGIDRTASLAGTATEPARRFANQT